MNPAITVVSGIRDIDPAWEPQVALSVTGELPVADEIRFGGAIGVDTMALDAVCGAPEASLVVYVPFTVSQQPKAAQRVIRECADRVVELGLRRSKRAYLDRNRAMLEGAHRLLAFTDGRDTGGTAWTVREAERLGLDVILVPVVGSQTRPNPRIEGPFSAPVYAWAKYVNRRLDPGHWPSKTVRDIKAGRAKMADQLNLADALAVEVRRRPELQAADAIVPMPRQIQNAARSPSDFDSRPKGPRLRSAIPWQSVRSGALRW